MTNGRKPAGLVGLLLGGHIRNAEIARRSLAYHAGRTVRRPVRTVLRAATITAVIVALVAFSADPQGVQVLLEEGPTVGGVVSVLPNPFYLALIAVLSFGAGLVLPITTGVRRDVRYRRMR